MKSHENHTNKIVSINVGGSLFQCLSSTLKTFPGSKLSTLDEQSSSYNALTGHHFFDRNPLIFSYLLDGCRTGSIHLPRDQCGIDFQDEMNYWGLSTSLVGPCCWKELYKPQEEKAIMEKLQDTQLAYLRTRAASRSTRTRLWLLLDQPTSSKGAVAWALFVATVVMVSIVVSGLEMTTVPILTYQTYQTNDTVSENSTKTRLNPMPMYADIACFAIISAELCLCFVVCPNKHTFLRSWLRVSDGICCVSFWLFAAIELCGISKSFSAILLTILRTLTCLKILRLFRISRSMQTFNVMKYTVSVSLGQMSFLAIALLLMTSLFGYVIFMLESKTAPEKMGGRMFRWFYWALITLTTVGYGDLVPSSTVGRFVACLCAVCGIIFLALPVGVIASNFKKYHDYQKYVFRHISKHYDELVTGNEHKKFGESLEQFQVATSEDDRVSILK